MNELKMGEMIGGRYKVIRPMEGTACARYYEVSPEPAQGGKANAETRLMAKVILGEDVRKGYERSLIKYAQAWAAIKHPNVTNVVDAGETNQGVFIVSEMPQGRDLSTLLSQKKSMRWNDAKPIFLDASAALSAIHDAGLVHGDIAPDQILLVEGPGGMGAKLLSPDLILAASSELYGRPGILICRKGYVSPEQVNTVIMDARPWSVTGLVDIFALGAVLHRTLTGQSVFEGDNDAEVIFSRLNSLPKAPSERVPGISSDIDALVMRALRIEPRDRYRSAAEFRAAMESVRS